MQRGESVGAAEPSFEEVVTASLPVSEEEQVVEQAVQGQVYPPPEQAYEPGYQDQPGQGQQV
ncbi:MAG TPA: hypothetical protein VIH83_05765 [Candidatus Bathyarchaeia archaeon]